MYIHDNRNVDLYFKRFDELEPGDCFESAVASGVCVALANEWDDSKKFGTAVNLKLGTLERIARDKGVSLLNAHLEIENVDDYEEE